jgi:hypothetical protein
MKKIINGAKYDTTTARELGVDSYSNAGDFNHWVERLYRTKSGKYFLYGVGGPMSRYAESTGQNQWSGSSKIIPMDRDSAMEWAEKHLSADEYEAAFGEVDEGEEKESLNIMISPALKSKLWALAEEQKKTISFLVEELLQKAIQ